MTQAIDYSKRGTCNRLKVGCVIVTDTNLLISEGYNGSISGQEHCIDVGCLMDKGGHCIRTIHAEQNAILNAAKKGSQIKNCTAYVTAEPCEHCAKLLIQSGVNRIIYLKPYRNEYKDKLISSIKGIEVYEYDGPNKEALLRELALINPPK